MEFQVINPELEKAEAELDRVDALDTEAFNAWMNWQGKTNQEREADYVEYQAAKRIRRIAMAYWRTANAAENWQIVYPEPADCEDEDGLKTRHDTGEEEPEAEHVS